VEGVKGLVLLPGKTRVGLVDVDCGLPDLSLLPWSGGGSGKSQARGTMAAGITQVEAHTTPLPLSAPLIAPHSKSKNCEMYRTKGRISLTPLLKRAKAVRKLRAAPWIDLTFAKYAMLGGGRQTSIPHQYVKTDILSVGG